MSRGQGALEWLGVVTMAVCLGGCENPDLAYPGVVGRDSSVTVQATDSGESRDTAREAATESLAAPGSTAVADKREAGSALDSQRRSGRGDGGPAPASAGGTPVGTSSAPPRGAGETMSLTLDAAMVELASDDASVDFDPLDAGGGMRLDATGDPSTPVVEPVNGVDVNLPAADVGSLEESCSCPSSPDVCTRRHCEPGSSVCLSEPATDEPCDDADPCTENDRCTLQQQCAGVAKNCSGLNTPCGEGVCEPDTGSCQLRLASPGTACEDGNLCTELDACNSEGKCIGLQKDCTALDSQCAVGICEEESGDCATAFTVGNCDDGDDCTLFDGCNDGVCSGVVSDDCDSIRELDVSTGSASVAFSTDCASNDFDVRRAERAGDCVRSSGRDVMFALDLSHWDHTVTLVASTDHTDTSFDTVIALTSPECSDRGTLVCNDDVDFDAGRVKSVLTTRVEPGIYVLVVDGYSGGERGAVELSVTID